jgi:hypothetical protein
MSVPPATPIGVPTETPTHRADPGGGNGPTSSPLLFFVALGFGVVFTNLWYFLNSPLRSLNFASPELCLRPALLTTLAYPQDHRRSKILFPLQRAPTRPRKWRRRTRGPSSAPPPTSPPSGKEINVLRRSQPTISGHEIQNLASYPTFSGITNSWRY